MDETDESKSVDKVIVDLRAKFPLVPGSVIEDIVRDKYGAFDGAPVRDYIPVMVRREAAESLREVIRASRDSHPSLRSSRQYG